MPEQNTAILEGLNEKQTEAVVSDAKRLLVLAGAGSGKTKTLLQKIIYLIEEKKVHPSSILAITFTKNATNEMMDRLIVSADSTGMYERIIFSKVLTKKEKDIERINWQRKYKWIEGLTVRTFHSFCYSVLRSDGVKEFDNKFKIIGDEKASDLEDVSNRIADETVFEVFHKLFIEKCENNDFLLKTKRYILDYLVDKIHIAKEFETPKVTNGKYYTSLNGTKVKSKSEQYIADWLYRHSIPFEYEPLLNVKDFDFHPDFYIQDANLYLEHVSDKSYPMEAKEKQFAKGNILYAKTFENHTQDSALFNHTLDQIVKSRLPINFHQDKQLSYLEEFNGYYEEVKDFVRQIIRICDMIKVENIAIEDVIKRAANDKHERIRVFYELAIPIINDYINYSTNKSYLDFNDLITKTASLFTNYEDVRQRYQDKFQYILVDEFQDVNNLQVELIKLLIKPDTQLFCVGDDWQSIYGFRGSNVEYIINFEKYFSNAQVIKLNQNYRSEKNIVDASNEVIKYNKHKIDKDIAAVKDTQQKIIIQKGNNLDDNVRFCIEKIQELLEDGYAKDDILFLYRRNNMFSNYRDEFKQHKFFVNAKTIHASKGLEAKVVFIIGLTEGKGGFPDVWLEDRLFQIIKTADYNLLLEEERRLFYVAITRAKDKLYLVTEKGNESSFLNEIPEVYTSRSKQLEKINHRQNECENCHAPVKEDWVACPKCGSIVKL
ncbi:MULTISPECIES: ATP-dependent helicase [Flavobacterium]|uniref:ATP-dependent helicase n=1 Tax=Flavobacterium TaxID=237 RepID=UPI001FCAB2D3|nr:MULTISPECIES: ATP-dependent helicase [Flavobacterium]UOK41496.1 ATP-dependent helicase [Flavobacterium enshiense]